MSRWRPSPIEERWLAVAAELGDSVPRASLAGRTGGWRSTGPLARIALFVLGLVAATLVVGILGLSHQSVLLVAGAIVTIAAEWLSVRKRLHASGIEEGLCLAGYLLIGAWITTVMYPRPGFGGAAVEPILIAAAAAAGLRRLNPFVTTCAAIAFVYWLGSTAAGDALDRLVGDGMTVLVLGCALAALALALGVREYRRPSHDRMLDWLVATLPIAAYAQYASWDMFDPAAVSGGYDASRLFSVLLLAALGATLLAVGVRRRRHAPLWGFLGCLAGIAVELHAAIGLAPETWLILCGVVALVAGVALDRHLRESRDGLTSASLTSREGPLELLQIVGTAVLARGAAEPRPAEPGFKGGGGKFGGGGASGAI